MLNTDSDWLLPRLSETALALRAGKGANTVCSKWYVCSGSDWIDQIRGYPCPAGAVRVAPTQNQLGIWPWLYVLPVTGIVCMGRCVHSYHAHAGAGMHGQVEVQ